jgi:hypothetical protein
VIDLQARWPCLLVARSIVVVPELPKTRSGKIMRRLLRDVAENREVGDATTLADGSVIDLISTRVRGEASDDLLAKDRVEPVPYGPAICRISSGCPLR